MYKNVIKLIAIALIFTLAFPYMTSCNIYSKMTEKDKELEEMREKLEEMEDKLNESQPGKEETDETAADFSEIPFEEEPNSEIIIPEQVIVESDQEETIEVSDDEDGFSYDEERLYPDIPDNIDFGGYCFRILSYDNFSEWTVRDMYAEELNEEPINDSVYNRNKAIEEQFNIEIYEVSLSNAYEMARKSIAAGLDEYDLIVIPSTSQMALAQNGYLYRLDEMEYLDPYKPWWDTNSYESLSVANAHFVIVGDLQIMDKDATWVQFFNKKMIEDYALENPFDLVKNNEWTIEKQLEMIKVVTDDTNGDGLYTKDDTFGMVSTTFSPMGYFYGFGEQIVTKNSEDIPELTMNTPRISQIVKYIDEICSVDSKIAFTGAPNDVLEVFEQGRGLFMGEVLQHTNMLRESDADFGIIPYPKYDKNQENYYSVVHPVTCMLSVPLTISDSERNSIIMEALCSESKYTLRQTYYDTALTTKFLRYDDASSEMLDLIFDNRVYDMGFINDWGSYYSGFIGLFTSGSTDFASMYAKNESKALKTMDTVVEAYMDF